MKSKELLKLNERFSLVECRKDDSGEIFQYCVCSYYNKNAPEGKKWIWGHYFTELEDAIKYAALHCYAPIHKYVLLEMDTCNNVNEQIFSNYDEAYKMFKERFDNYSSYTECYHAEIVDDGNGNTVGELWFNDEQDVELKILDVIV